MTNLYGTFMYFYFQATDQEIKDETDFSKSRMIVASSMEEDDDRDFKLLVTDMNPEVSHSYIFILIDCS